MAIMCWNGAISARESNASSVLGCIDAVDYVRIIFAWIVKHLLRALITLIVEKECATNALSLNAAVV